MLWWSSSYESRGCHGVDVFVFIVLELGRFYVPVRPNYQQLPTTFVTYCVTTASTYSLRIWCSVSGLTRLNVRCWDLLESHNSSRIWDVRRFFVRRLSDASFYPGIPIDVRRESGKKSEVSSSDLEKKLTSH